MSHDVMQSFVTLSANSPYFTIKTESFAHALSNDDSAKPRNRSIVTRPFPSMRAGSGYETRGPQGLVSFPDPHVLPPERGSGIYNVRILGCAESACVWKFRNVT